MNSTMHIYPINGAAHRVAPDATAFAYRDANFATVIAGMWPDPATERGEHEVGARLLRRHRAALGGRAGTSTSWPATTRAGSRPTTRGNYDRLVEVKRKYDPDNLFHLNQNIAPQ